LSVDLFYTHCLFDYFLDTDLIDREVSALQVLVKDIEKEEA